MSKGPKLFMLVSIFIGIGLLVLMASMEGNSGGFVKHFPLVLRLGTKRSAAEWMPPKASSVYTDSRKRLILIGTTLFGSKEWQQLPIKDAANFANISRCEFNNCEVSYDQERLRESDAVVFHARDMPDAKFLRHITAKDRPSSQRWVYFILENPLNTADPKPLNGLFNWTMSYKVESDIFLPYKKYNKIKSNSTELAKIDYAKEKNKIPNRGLVMWVCSHCGRLRDKLVEKLQTYVSVNVAGNCAGNFKNPLHNCNNGGKEACMKQINNYKFYLAAENEFCDQYVTEKYWYNALEHNAVPIVFGAGPYHQPSAAIPGSFINAADFSSVKALADYLIYLDKNDTAYNEYFNWKSKYELNKDRGWVFADIWVCDICRKLHTDYSVKVYNNLSDFWSREKDCAGKDFNVTQMIKRD